uniref:Uncharacterized protein n=1 Tax=Romanomermis culicivorax TaxID=13658 RepID=A0A915I030_ROMCU
MSAAEKSTILKRKAPSISHSAYRDRKFRANYECSTKESFYLKFGLLSSYAEFHKAYLFYML